MKTQFNFTTCTCCALFHLQSIAIMHLHLHVKLHENLPFYSLYVLCIVSCTINCNHASAFAWKSPFLQPVRVVHCFNCNWKGVSACKVVWKHNLTSQPVRVVHCNSASAFAFQIAWKSPLFTTCTCCATLWGTSCWAGSYLRAQDPTLGWGEWTWG